MTSPADPTVPAKPAADDPHRHPPGYRLRRGQNWFFLGLSYASYYFCRYNLSNVAPELKRDLGFSNAQYGMIQSCRDIAYAVGQFINGLFTDRLGGKLAMTVGALGTVVLNVVFGLVAWSKIGYLLYVLALVRLLDGYLQAFGAPGMVKINTAWFRRQERGGFAGIFGGMIQLGQIGASQLARMLVTGASVPLLFYSLTVPKVDWRYMFFIPPAAVVVIIVLMNLLVKNHPEEAGYRIVHDDEEASDDPHGAVRLGDVFRRITRNKTVWIIAAAYFCTGFVRRSIESWWVVYLEDVWGAKKDSIAFIALAWLLPLTAFLGSMGSGLVSDRLFAGRRAPVAAVIYLTESLFIGVSLLVSFSGGAPMMGVALALLVGVNITCNSSHSILGTAAPMDLGGRKMAGFALGVIDSFQYFGATLAGFWLGSLMDSAATRVWRATAEPAATLPSHLPIHAATWFGCMLPFALLGGTLMTYLWIRHRGTDERGA